MTIKYIKNKDLLEEIQRSKATYCHFVSPEYSTYDVVVTSVDEVTPALLASTIATKASKMSTKLAPVDPKSIDPEKIVFRVMTDGHLPPETDEKRRKKSSTGEWVTKPNFPPFKHYIIKKGKPVEVGRSHWKDGLHNGQFSIDHGKITNRLAQMFMLLVEQFSHRGNFRGYCVDEQTEALTQRGWLSGDQITEEDMILSYDAGALKWSRIKSIYRDDEYDGKMFNLTVTGLNALVTPGHKFITTNGLKEVDYLLEKDKIILTGTPVEDGNEEYNDAFVELVGWYVTEGNLYLRDEKTEIMTIYQNEGIFAESIRNCLDKMNTKFSEYSRQRTDEGKIQVRFTLPKAMATKILEVAPNKVLSNNFILSLTQHQRELLIKTMINGDGWNRTQNGADDLFSYCQKDKDHVDAFLYLLTIAGYRASCRQTDIVSYGKPSQIYIINMFSPRCLTSSVESIDFHGGKSGRGLIGKGKASNPYKPTVDYKGKVW